VKDKKPSPLLTSRDRMMYENQLWKQIRTAAIHDPALKEILDQARVFYILKYASPNDNSY
jgi:hypothetical protein